MGNPMDISQKLLDLEKDRAQKMAMEHAKKLMEAKTEIEKILVDRGLTWRDWGDISKMITNTCIYSFDKTQLLTIFTNDKHSNATDRTEREIEQPGQGSSSEG